MSAALDNVQRHGLKASIARNDRELRDALERLKDTVVTGWDDTRDRVDVRVRIIQQPALYLGMAFCMGLWLGARGGKVAFLK